MQMIHQAASRIFTPGFASDRGHTPAFPQSDIPADKGLVSQLLAGREGAPPSKGALLKQRISVSPVRSRSPGLKSLALMPQHLNRCITPVVS